jgi:DNA-binding CsgD family transcriptional regulator
MPVATRWPLVGRRDELDVFARALDDARCDAMCIYGLSGVGKTRLGDECLGFASDTGRRVFRASADGADSGSPLAAIAHLLPADALQDWRAGQEPGSVGRARMLDAVRRVLEPAGVEPGRPVLLLDDVHRIDRSSLAVVDHLLTHDALFVVATVNSDYEVPDTVTQWWGTDRAVRVDLGPLDAVGVDTLLHVVLEGPLDGRASDGLWRTSQGNLLILHELVLGAQADGALAERDGVWRLDGPLGAPARLTELLAQRVTGLTPDGRAILELLALCQPVGLGQLESRFGLDELEELDRDGLIATRADGRRQFVSLAHPLHGEVIRADLPAERARSIMLDHAEAVDRLGARRRDDPIRIVSWRLAATGHADPDLLLRAAGIARHDHDFATTARLADASLAIRPTPEGGLLLGEALHNLCSFDEAEAVLAEAAGRATDDELGGRLAAMRRRNLFFGGAGEVAGTASTTSAAYELLAVEAAILTASGHPLEALALLDRADIVSPRARVVASIPRAAALAMTGRTGEALQLTQQAGNEHLELEDLVGVPVPASHGVNELFALVQAGQLDTAEERGRARFDQARGAHDTMSATWLGVHLSRCALAQGRPRSALRWLERLSLPIGGYGLDGLRPIGAAIRALAFALLGDAAASTAAADDIERFGPGFGQFATELRRGRAWALLRSDDVDGARGVLMAAADDAERSGLVPAAAWALHDAIHAGAAKAVAPRLAALAEMTDSAIVHVQADHAAALVAGDPVELAASATKFEALGAMLLATEAAAAAAAAFRGERDEAAAAALDERARELAARCESARTPAPPPEPNTPQLSSREHDIAALAAQGLSSRDIADRLSISVRTVDNHLGRVYAKLGVANRAELAAAFTSQRREDGRP